MSDLNHERLPFWVENTIQNSHLTKFPKRKNILPISLIIEESHHFDATSLMLKILQPLGH